VYARLMILLGSRAAFTNSAAPGVVNVLPPSASR
jgi:hypothetical protein